MTSRERKYHYTKVFVHWRDGIGGLSVQRVKARNKKMNKAINSWLKEFKVIPTNEIYKPVPVTDKWGNNIYGVLPAMKAAFGESVTITLTEKDHLK